MSDRAMGIDDRQGPVSPAAAAGGRTGRQDMIDGWDPEALATMSMAVIGESWPALFTAAGAGLLGVGGVTLVGRPDPATERFHAELLDPVPDVARMPTEPRSAAELRFLVGPADLIAVCTSDEERRRLSVEAAEAMARPAPVATPTGVNHPASGLGLAALIVDSARVTACPALGTAPSNGDLCFGADLPAPPHAAAGPVVLLGVGGIGTWVAAAAAASGIRHLVLVDDDRVEMSNLNRQLLFRLSDALGSRPKAEAAAEALRRCAPGIRATPLVRTICRDGDPDLAELLRPFRPAALVSALDNAAGRICAFEAAAALGVPLVHAGTDLAAADVYSQVPEGPTVNDQMWGALDVAAAEEGLRREGRCVGAYVVPSMMAAAMAVDRLVRLTVSAPEKAPSPVHWRAGAMPAVSEWRARRV